MSMYNDLKDSTKKALVAGGVQGGVTYFKSRGGIGRSPVKQAAIDGALAGGASMATDTVADLVSVKSDIGRSAVGGALYAAGRAALDPAQRTQRAMIWNALTASAIQYGSDKLVETVYPTQGHTNYLATGEVDDPDSVY